LVEGLPLKLHAAPKRAGETSLKRSAYHGLYFCLWQYFSAFITIAIL
jgi:hypothetical protein